MFSNTDLLLEVDENKLNNAMRVLIKRSESTSHLANVKRYKKGIGKEKVQNIVGNYKENGYVSLPPQVVEYFVTIVGGCNNIDYFYVTRHLA